MCTDAIRFAGADGAPLPGRAGKQSQGETPRLDPRQRQVPVCSDEDAAAVNHPLMSNTFGVRLTREGAHTNKVVLLFSFFLKKACIAILIIVRGTRKMELKLKTVSIHREVASILDMYPFQENPHGEFLYWEFNIQLK